MVELTGSSSNFRSQTHKLAIGLPDLLATKIGRTQSCRSEGNRPHRLEPDQIAQLVADYRSGASIKALVRTYRVHNMTVKAHLLRAGIVVESFIQIDPVVQAEVVQLYLAGHSMRVVAEQVGLSEPSVSCILRIMECPIGGDQDQLDRTNRGDHLPTESWRALMAALPEPLERLWDCPA